MSDRTLQISKEVNYVKITLNRPKALNALNRELMQELRDFFTAGYQSYEPFAAVVITGAGEKAFAAGADISEFLGLDSTEGTEFARFGHDTFFAIEHFHKPVIAAVNGFALGGGCELAMACHLRIASENARFGPPEVNLGLIPVYGGRERVRQVIGKGKAMELLLTGDMIVAEEAKNLGLVNHVVSPEELIGACEALIGKIATKGPLAVSGIIETVNAHYNAFQTGYAAEAGVFGQLMTTSDFREGTAAFLEKRRAEFKGE